jgi:drug/metabolite transporter (DMT)-like permease
VSPTAIALILVAALAHATWNLLSKQASAAGAVSFIWLVSAAATGGYAPVIAIAVIIGQPRLTGPCWLFMAGTGLLQAGYFLFLQNGYRLGDLSLVYPVGRGTGALLAALAGVVILGERPGPVAVAGIGCVVAGIILIALPGATGSTAPARAAPGSAAPGSAALGSADPGSAALGSADPGSAAPARAAVGARARKGPSMAGPTAFALLTGTFIASYTLWDKFAVTSLRTPPLLQGYAAFPVMALLFAPLARRAGGRTALVWRAYRAQVIGAAVLAPLAYILVLIALSFTAVSAVAPAREVSVLFGVLLGRRLLGEGSLPRRLAAAAAIVAGIVAIAVG